MSVELGKEQAIDSLKTALDIVAGYYTENQAMVYLGMKIPYSSEQKIRDEEFIKCFWRDLLKIKDEPTTVRINGEHYIIGLESAPKSMKGMGGDKKIILFNDGRKVETTNLWHQTEIPSELEPWLPDNAEFISR